ncbi:ATP-dependent DNA helicase [Aquabacterium sp.]|uniref:ATP-dependent DNA helicase n=1 Tax=Aquabacterium sp. TaxID=1872578 RepID=UPI0025BA4670|nr:ATP-dependent DNA helicase [Aquabacterium sp.]
MSQPALPVPEPVPQPVTATEPGYTVAVRALCEFTAKQGDLDLRFTPSPTAAEGMAGHALVAGRRGTGYLAELPLSGTVGPLRLRGRADGYDPRLNRLEEFKTFKGQLERQPANHRHLHWAQLKCYGALLCGERGLPEVELALVYLDVGTQQETVLTARHSAADLAAFLADQCARFLAWAQLEMAHRAARNEALAALAFPHADFRLGQRPLAEAVYKAAVQARCLMAQAPTGIGKTMGTVFPLLKAAPGQGLDKLYFLTAKTSGRALALDAIGLLQQRDPDLPLRTLELVARDKACEHPDLACHGESCPLAKGFYDRLPAARAAAVMQPLLDKATVRAVAASHQVCPYYLGQELARWADVVVGDYNHYFDLNAMLHGLAQANHWRVGVLVDEAHNLVDRGRSMYSAEMAQHSLRALRHTAPAALKSPLDKLHRAWSALNKAHAATQPYAVLDDLPAAWLKALLAASGAISTWFSEHPDEVDAPLQGFYLQALQFTRLAELFDAHALCDLTFDADAGPHAKASSTVSLRNVVPAPFLKPRFEAAHTVTVFSATLQPEAYFRAMLGLPENTVAIEAPSPFKAEQLQVHVARQISTRYADRAASMPAMVALMAQQFSDRPGNYLAFFSSHDYLQEVAARLQAQHPGIPVWKQSRRMSEAEQAAFLDRFTEGGQGIGFAVLGGSFGEGVDLPGQRLIGAFIATLGLPQLNPVNEQFCARLEQLLGEGYDYTYVIPGLHKVVQAAGRVIRTVSDQGVVHLMDDRYQRRQIKALLPGWWRVD